MPKLSIQGQRLGKGRPPGKATVSSVAWWRAAIWAQASGHCSGMSSPDSAEKNNGTSNYKLAAII
jgi:hypothetical protein